MEYQISAVLRLKDMFTAKLQNAKQAVSNLGKSAAASTRAATANVKSAISAIEKSATSMANLRINLNAGDLARIERLKSTLESAGQHVSKPLNIRANDQATSRLQKIKSELENLVNKPWVVNVRENAKEMLGRAKGKITDGISSGMAMAGATAMGLGAIGGMTYGVADAFKSQISFEKNLSGVKAILSGAYKDPKDLDNVMTELTARAEDLGATTKFTAAEAATGMQYLGMAGWGKEQIIAGIKPILDLAAAGDTDLGTTSDIVSDAMTGFGLKAGEYITNSQGNKVEASQMFSDLMAALVTNANTNIPMLGETLKYVAPNVGALYSNGTAEDRLLGAQDTMFISGLMANSGIKSSQAGTAARAILTRLAAQNRNAYFGEQIMGVDLAGENGEARRLKDIFGDFREKFKNGLDPDQLIEAAEMVEGTKIHADTRRKLETFLANAQKNGGKITGIEMQKMAAMIAGQEAMTGFLAAVTASDADWDKLGKALDEAEGAAGRMAEIRMDNLAGDITYLSSAWDAFSRNLIKGDASAGLREFTQAATATLSKANELFKDGIDIGDFGEIIVDVIAKLKAKFMELDGIGSLLAGGALVFGLKKILSLGLKVKDTFSALTKVRTAGDIGNLIRGGAAQAGGLQSVGAMNINAGTVNIRAGVVNLSGAVKGLGGAASAGARGGVVNAGGKLSAVQIAEQKAQRQAIVAARAQSKSDAALGAAWAKPGDAKLMAQYRQADLRATQAAARASLLSAQAATLRASEERAAAYYAKRESVLLQQRQAAELAAVNQNISSQVAAQRRERLGGVAGAGALAAVFGVIDVAATRSNSNYNLNEAQKNLDYQKNQLKILRDEGADVDQINAQLETIRQAEANVQQVTETNAINERRAGAGAAGMVAGTAIGAYLGSFVPILGNMLGGIIGGYIGQWVGEKAADFTNPFQSPQQKQEAILRHYSEGITRHNNDSKIKAEERQQIILEKEQQRQESELKKYSASITRHNEDSRLTAAQREQRRVDEANKQREQYKNNQTRISAGKGPDYDRQKAFGGTSLSDFNQTDWTDPRGAGMQTVDKDSPDIQKKREEFASGVAKNQSELSRIDTIVREGQERQQWYNQKFFGGLEGGQKFNYNPLEPFNVGELSKPTAPAAQTETGTASVSDFRKLEEQTASATEQIKSAAEQSETSSATEQIKTNDYTILSATGNVSTGYENRGVMQTAEDFGKPAAATASAEEKIPATENPSPASPVDATSLSATGNKSTGLENRGVMQHASTETTAAIENLRQMFSNFSLEDLFFSKAAASATHEESDEQNFRDLKGYERPDIPPPEKEPLTYSATSDLSGAAANTGNAPVNFGQPDFSSLPDFNIAEKISSEIENVKSAIESAKSSASATFDEISNNISQSFDSAKNAVTSGITEIGTSIGESFENVKSSISAGIETFSESFSAGFEGVKTSAATFLEEMTSSLSTGFENFTSSVASGIENFTTSFSTGFESVKTSASSVLEEISTSISTGFESLLTAATSNIEALTMTFSTGFESLTMSVATTFESIAMTAATGLETLQMTAATALESISMTFSTTFESILMTTASIFESVTATVSAGAEAAHAAISSAFSSAAAEVQGIWGAIPGFFSGIFGGLGGIAAAAGSAIAAGINSGIGMIMSAWEALSGWLSAKIASLSSMAASAASFVGIGGNATGTASWRGGFTTVNEHGGELIILPSGNVITPYQTTKDIIDHNYGGTNSFLGGVAHNYGGTNFFEGGWSETNGGGSELMFLPRGTKIIPHAPTVNILRRQIREKLNSANSFSTAPVSHSDLTLDNLTGDDFSSYNNIVNAGSSRSGNVDIVAQSHIFKAPNQRIFEHTDSLGNLIGVDIPDYNRITSEDSLTVKHAKQIAQQKLIAHNYSGTSSFAGGWTTINEHGGEIISLPNGAMIYPKKTAIDALGNIRGLKIPEYNRITRDDSLVVRRAKYQAQLKQYRAEKFSKQMAGSVKTGKMSRPASQSVQGESSAPNVLSGSQIINSELSRPASQSIQGETSSATNLASSTTLAPVTSSTSITSANQKSPLERAGESISNYFYKIFHPRKYAAQKANEDIFAQSAFDSGTSISSATGLSNSSISSATGASDLSMYQQVYSAPSVSSADSTTAKSRVNWWKVIGSIVNANRSRGGWLNVISTVGDMFFNKKSATNNSGTAINSATSINGATINRLPNMPRNNFVSANSGTSFVDDFVNIWRASRGGNLISADKIWRPTLSNSFASTKPRTNIFEDIVSIWRQSKGGNLLSADKIWKPILNNQSSSKVANFGGSLLGLAAPSADVSGAVNVFGQNPNLPTQLPNLSTSLEMGSLPELPKLDMSGLEQSSSSSSTTNNSNSNSSATFNFGGVNINNGGDFEEFIARLKSLLVQSADNFGGI